MAIAYHVHILGVLLDLGVGGLLEDVVLAVVNLVQQVLVVDAQHLILQQGPIGLLVLFLYLHCVLLGLLALSALLFMSATFLLLCW